MDLHAALASLSCNRPVFHSEADFQHSLAWQLREQYRTHSVRLEYRAPIQPQRGYIDIWMSDANESVAIELKYKTRALRTTINDESFDLLDQSAQDIARYDTLKDLQRLEAIVASVSGSRGCLLLLTNDASYWKPMTRAA